jgi:hypothetical protein
MIPFSTKSAATLFAILHDLTKPMTEDIIFVKTAFKLEYLSAGRQIYANVPSITSKRTSNQTSALNSPTALQSFS